MIYRATGALRGLGCTDFSPLEDELVAGHRPTVFGDNLHQLELYFIWVIGVRPAQPVCDPFYMGIDGDGLLAEGIS